jgi:hypothetical protein
MPGLGGIMPGLGGKCRVLYAPEKHMQMTHTRTHSVSCNVERERVVVVWHEACGVKSDMLGTVA